MRKKLLLTLSFLFVLLLNVSAQRTTDKLDRGLVAVPSGSGAFVSWRIFGEEYYDTKYNLYRDGVKVNETPLEVSNYTDPQGKAGSRYKVAAVVRGVEQVPCAEVERLKQQYIQFAVKDLFSRRGTKITNDYNINDIALADVDGDGVSEFIMKRNYGPDGSSVENDSAYNCIECYRLNGERLWWIDLGPNMVSGPDEQYDAVGYDWDGDGKAEILMRGADNMIIHHADGSTTEIGNMKVNTRNTVLQTANMTYTNTGNEYLLYLEGLTGKPYPIGSNDALWIDYPLPRGKADDWGDGYGHRSMKHYFGAPFLDGRKPYIFLGRGCYTKHHMKAFSVNAETHKLTQYWEWKGESGVYYGQGFHNFGIADVDWDGRDEICFGSMVIDDNGKGLSTTGLGHGDAQHCSDFDPYRHGQEIFTCNEDHPAMNYRDATTSKIYYRLQSTGDDGRAICGNFSDSYPGAIGHSSQSGVVSCVSDKIITGAPSGFAMNWRIYWDGDLLEEALDGASSREGASRVFKADGSVVFTADGTANCNWTKNTPSATGDVLGDWREEIIVRTTDNKYVRVYTTNIATKWRNYTLWHDHQYRQGMVWETIGYNQPPHTSYFLGEMEGITMAPPPLTMTGRTEVANNGTIDASLNDKHLIICETNDTKINVDKNARPYMVTFNVPSWVQGTNSTVTTGTPTIRYTYYTCEVSGEAFTGSMRLVKQGDGVLTLPNVDMTYTGETNIWGGTVNFDGSLLYSDVWMNHFAELNSAGGTFRNITMTYDSKLRPGGENNRGRVTVDTLNMGFGSRVIFDIFDGKATDLLTTNLLTIEKKNWQYGPQYLTPVFEFVYQGSGTLTPGTYHIGQVKEISGSLTDIRIEGIDSKMKAELKLSGSNLYLEISGMRSAADIAWTGSESNIWDLANTKNFVSNDGSGNSDWFVTGDKVRFSDNATIFGVNINSDLEADSVIIDNTKAYTFQGSGSLSGETKLIKRNKGMLTIKTENTYTGGNRISGGVVSVSSLSNATQSKGNLGGVTTLASKFVIENGGELRTTAAVTNGSPVKFESEEGGIINNTQDFIVNKPMSGTLLTKKGSGWMKLNTSNGNLDRLAIAAGTVQCINANVPAKTVEYQGGTLNENTGSSYNVYVPKGKQGTWYLANRSDYSNKVTGEGTLTIYCTTEKGSNYYATRTQVKCDFSNFEGVLKPTSSQDDPSCLRFTLNTSSGLPKGTMNIAAGVEVQNSGKTFRIGKLTGSGALGGSCTFSNGTTVGANTWQVGNDESWTNTVKVTSNANLVKVGSGKITWSVANDNTGTTAINEGEIAINAKSSFGTGKLTVAANGILSGANSVSKPLNNETTINGMLRPGTLEGSSVGTIYFASKNVTFGANSVLVIGAGKCASGTSNGCTALDGIAKLIMNGTIRIVPTNSNTLQVGDSIRLWNASAQLVGTPKFEMVNGITWDTSRISEGVLLVKDIDTGINSLFSNSTTVATETYDLNGRKMPANRPLKSGIYIRNGKKIVVK